MHLNTLLNTYFCQSFYVNHLYLSLIIILPGILQIRTSRPTDMRQAPGEAARGGAGV